MPGIPKYVVSPKYLPEIPDQDFEIREEIKSYALDNADDWYRQFLLVLYAGWESYNELYFEGLMHFPLILISDPSSPRALGDCAVYNGFGGRSQIRIRPSVLTGNHRVFEIDEPREGVQRYYLDVLLHEMIHQWQYEVLKVTESGYRGHGPLFAGKCNEIGDQMGLGLVGFRKSKKGPAVPRCSYWPMVVRDPDYYLGVLKESVHQGRTRRQKKNGEAARESSARAKSVIEFVRQLPVTERGEVLQRLWTNYSDEMRRFDQGEDPRTIWPEGEEIDEDEDQ